MLLSEINQLPIVPIQSWFAKVVKISTEISHCLFTSSIYLYIKLIGADENHTFIEGFSFVIQAKSKENQIKKTGGDDIKVISISSSYDE